jgi:predicted O-methyltransferase YrrM
MIADVRPDLTPVSMDLRSELAFAYDEYTRDVSPDNMAVSLLTATYLLFLCRSLGAKRVADFGSGFTSYVLARYAAETEAVTVTSVDDDAEWLGKTKTFIETRGFRSNLTMWDDYCEADIHHDVACYDLGKGDVRNRGMELVARRTRPGGVVLFDDAMHDGHRSVMEAISREFRWDLFFLQDQTTDSYGRFAALLVKP